MLIREAAAGDWLRIWPFWHRIVAAGETYAWDPDTSEDAARALWMNPAKRVFVVEDETGAIVASAYVTPNYAGPAARIANAGFMVDPDRGGRGYGRALAEHVLAAAQSDPIKALLKDHVRMAKARGLFGAPSFLTADGELFWGNDRLEQALDWAVRHQSREHA